MPPDARPHEPRPGERGLASAPLAELAASLDAAWSAFLDVVAGTDLDAPTRLPGWRGREVVAHLGSWPEQDRLARRLAEARGAGAPSHEDQDALNAAVLAHHAQDDPDQLGAALVRARERAARFLASPEARRWGRQPVSSVLGPLPLVGVVAATTYELAVHALDLASGGGPDPEPGLLLTGLGSLLDCTGGLVARSGEPGDTRLAAFTPDGCWRLAVRGADWSVERTALRPARTAVLEGSAATLLDASAGRLDVPAALATRRLRLHGLPELLTLVPVLEAVPGIPGGAVLRLGAGQLARMGRLLERLPHPLAWR